MKLLRNLGTHIELFAVLANHAWDLPDSVPPRFEGRVSSTHGVLMVDSRPGGAAATNRHSLRRNGIWMVPSDAVPRGGVEPRVFGIPLSPRLVDALCALPDHGATAVYHGTDAANLHSIAASGLWPTKGQLGFGVYVGSFWKACRFAARTQDYTPRDHPLVVRCIMRPSRMTVYPRADWACACGTCVARGTGAYCDHARVWDTGAGELLVLRTWADHWTTRNEEWVVAPREVECREAVLLDRASIKGPQYDPLQRDIRIR